MFRQTKLQITYPVNSPTPTAASSVTVASSPPAPSAGQKPQASSAGPKKTGAKNKTEGKAAKGKNSDKSAAEPSASKVDIRAPVLPQNGASDTRSLEHDVAVAGPSIPPQHTGQPVEPATPVTPVRPLAQKPASEPRSGSVMVAIPPVARPEEFQAVDDTPVAPDHLSARKRKRDQFGQGDDMDGDGLNLRQRADGALQALHRGIYDILEAERQAAHSGNANNLVVLTIDRQTVMTSSAHQKLIALIQAAIHLGSFSHVPVDDLIRIQRLAESGLTQADSLGMKIDLSWQEPDVAVWAQQLPDVETSLRAARTTLQIMSGGREEKELYSEDMTQKALDLFRNVVDGIVVPIAELRSSGQSASLFKAFAAHKKAIGLIFTNCQRILALMATLIRSVELSESVVNMLEAMSSTLMFVENGHVERDAVVGVQKFDNLRTVAMDMLTQIFLGSPQMERRGIFDQILTSLEKLPLGKQGARQFKLADGGSIQPVSALIMRLVQASAGKFDNIKQKAREKALLSLEDSDDAGQTTTLPADDERRDKFQATEEVAAEQPDQAISQLQSVYKPLEEDSLHNALYVISFLVGRAVSATKSGDAPHRNLLDLFVEDFSTCLGSPDWPAAELFLWILSAKMMELISGDNPVQAKNMALDYLGIMCAAISKLRSHVRKLVSHLEGSSTDDLGRFVAELGLAALELKSQPEQMLSWTGPYRVTIEHLEGRIAEDPQLVHAISYLVVDWARKVEQAYGSSNDEERERDGELGRMAYRLRNMIGDRRWLSNEFSFSAVESGHAKLAYPVTLLRGRFCESFSRILNVLLISMSSDQAMVRSKSLKSVNQVLETDPSILDGDSTVIQLILECASDQSTAVRDSALGLIGKCIGMRPALERKLITKVMERFSDSGVGVRKRAMKLARDIYLRNPSKDVRAPVAQGILFRAQDPDEGVRELARQLIEEIWIYPFYNTPGMPSENLSITDHVTLVIQTLRNSTASSVVEKIIQAMLDPDSKTAEQTFDVCRRMVAAMFDLIDNPDSEDSSVVSGRDALHVLMMFAEANPKLFNFEQISLLQTRLTVTNTSEDFSQVRAVIVIYRKVLPQLSSAHTDFLNNIRGMLNAVITRAPRTLMDDTIGCLWTICELLGTTVPLMKLVASSLQGMKKAYSRMKMEPDKAEVARKQFLRYCLITGMVGKHCDLDVHAEELRQIFPTFKGNDVSRLLLNMTVSFAHAEEPEIREAALDAIGLVCQRWPRNYVSPNVCEVLQQVFDQRNPTLEAHVLRSFKEFLIKEEKRSEAQKSKASAGGDAEKRELTRMGSTNFDDVASATTQRFLKDITRIALSTTDEHALLAVEVLGSINRQGLVHPKETGVTFMTLETCNIPRISEMAYMEHRAAHEKHESVLEREYAKAIQAIFNYQRDIIKDIRGATTNPFTPKLHLLMEVLKISKSKNRTRFLDKLCSQIDFDANKLDVSKQPPPHVLFSRFVTENLAFLEFMTVGELQNTINTMEKLVTRTGATVAHLIESEVFQVRMDILDGDGAASGPSDAPGSTVSPRRLLQLASASVILSSVWEARTYLRKLYNLSSKREGKTKAPPKDLTKAPVKVQGVTGDRFWEEMSSITDKLATENGMLDVCRSFVELLNVDKEHRIAEEDEDLNGENPTTPQSEEDDEDGAPSAERGRGKRKATNTPGGRKKRPRSSSRSRPRGRPRKQSIADDAEGEFEDMSWI